MSLHVAYGDIKLNFEELPERNSSASVHSQNIKFLVIKILKVFNGTHPQFVKDITLFRERLASQSVKE